MSALFAGNHLVEDFVRFGAISAQLRAPRLVHQVGQIRWTIELHSRMSPHRLAPGFIA